MARPLSLVAFALALALAFSSTALAQGGQIFVVDAASGPGTNYTDIQAAVLAVPDGSTLLVRPGNYAPVTIDGKGVTVLADPVFTIVGPLSIRNSQPQQRVLLRGFVISGTGHTIAVANAAGPVTLDGNGAFLQSMLWGQSGLTVTDSPQVDVRNLTIPGTAYAPACAVTNSSVVFERCTLLGGDAFFLSKAHGAWGEPGLTATSSSVHLVHCSVFGGNGAVFVWMGITTALPASAAIAMTSSAVRALGLSAHQIAGGTNPQAAQAACMAGSGSARVDPLIVLNGPPSGVALTLATMPSLLADSALPGGVLTVQRHGAAGLLCAIALSLRAPASWVPWLPDPIWLDPASMIVEGAGVTPPSGPFVVTKNVPNAPTLRGFQFVWQSADLDATGLLAVSNPSPSFVR